MCLPLLICLPPATCPPFAAYLPLRPCLSPGYLAAPPIYLFFLDVRLACLRIPRVQRPHASQLVLLAEDAIIHDRMPLTQHRNARALCDSPHESETHAQPPERPAHVFRALLRDRSRYRP